MGKVTNYLNHLYFKRAAAEIIDSSIELASGCLGGYFGAMVAALTVVLEGVSPHATQRAIWTGLISGFISWTLGSSWINRVLVQGISRSSFGKKIMNLEIVSTGEAISWTVMMKYWASASLFGPLKIVSSLDTSSFAPVYSIHAKPAVGVQKTTDSEKKAA